MSDEPAKQLPTSEAIVDRLERHIVFHITSAMKFGRMIGKRHKERGLQHDTAAGVLTALHHDITGVKRSQEEWITWVLDWHEKNLPKTGESVQEGPI